MKSGDPQNNGVSWGELVCHIRSEMVFVDAADDKMYQLDVESDVSLSNKSPVDGLILTGL